MCNTIGIKPADKGGGVVIQDKTMYQAECLRLLSDDKNYRKLTYDPTEDLRSEIKSLVDHGETNGYISNKRQIFYATVRSVARLDSCIAELQMQRSDSFPPREIIFISVGCSTSPAWILYGARAQMMQQIERVTESGPKKIQRSPKCPEGRSVVVSGAVKGGSLIQVSISPLIHFTMAACEYFTEITFACLNDKSMEELRKWLKNEPDALDCSHAIKLFCELQGSSETWIEKQNIVQQKVKQICNCDMDRRDPLSPTVMPQADCLLLVHSVDFLAKDKKNFCDGVKNLSSLLKCGGHLIVMTTLETTFYMVGDVKFPHLCIDEGFLRNALTDSGFVIVEHHITYRKVQRLYDIMDYKGVIIVKARKERDI
ncbi:indolethylamine N-methyltransferase-like [Lissotriton helveticus]